MALGSYSTNISLELVALPAYHRAERVITMMRRSIKALFLATLASRMMTGQDVATYLDEYIVKVKPEKRVEFDAINKKMAAFNRTNKGDAWLAAENMYGENNVVTFVSLRSGFGDAQKAFD